MIKVIYNKVCGRCVQSEPLTSGMVGQPIHFEYSHDFDGLSVTAVFTDGKNTVDVVNPGNECIIPHEVLTTVGAMVNVGIYAVRGNELVIPTVYAHIGVVLKGADPSGDVSIDPSLPVWAQVQETIGNLSQIETEAKDNLVEAINELKHTVDSKQDKLIAGDNITIAADGKTISATGGGSTVELDTTLSETGKAADAKAVGDALAGKVDKVTGKGLSSNDYTDAAKAKVDALAPVATSGNYNDLTNKPTIPSVPKPLTYDYMPEGYPTKTMGTVTVMEEQAVEFASSGDGSPSVGSPTTTFTPVEGQTYIVNWDGTEHECVCSIFNGRFLVLGNLSIVGAGDDTGEPFIYINVPSMASEFETFDTASSHTISVKRIEETVTPIDEKYLPESAFTVAAWDLVSNRPFFNKPLNVNITAENITKDINLGSNYVDLGATAPDFNEGLYYKVEGEVAFLNNSADVSYPLQINGYYKANSRAELPLGTVYDGYSRANLDVSLHGNNSAADRGKLEVFTTHGYTIYYTISTNFTIISEVKQLPEDYIPNTIQRVGDDVIIPSSTSGSTKKFKITVDDTGTISATEVTT